MVSLIAVKKLEIKTIRKIKINHLLYLEVTKEAKIKKTRENWGNR
jgi:hypothetical protein